MDLYETDFDDRMNAGAAKFELNYASLFHLIQGGEKLPVRNGIAIERTVLLVDISKWQGEIDFFLMASSGVEGVVIKCGQGIARDPMFQTNMRGAKEAGLPRGTYWFFDSRISPKIQAYWWWQWIKDDPGELRHFADYEETYNGDYAGWENFYIFLSEFRRLTSLPSDKIGIYTGYYYWLAHSPTNTASLAWFAQFDLWLAWYTNNPAVVIIPKPWTNDNFILWQYGTPVNGRMRGVQSLEIDENNFNGNKVAYTQEFRLIPLPPPPPPIPPGDPIMTYYEIRSDSSSTRSIRVGPGVRNIKLSANGDLVPGRIAKAGAGMGDVFVFPADVTDSTLPTGFAAWAGDTWRKVFDNNGIPVNGWIAKIHLGETMITEFLVGVEEPTITLKHTIKIFSNGSYSVDDGPIIP